MGEQPEGPEYQVEKIHNFVIRIQSAHHMREIVICSPKSPLVYISFYLELCHLEGQQLYLLTYVE